MHERQQSARMRPHLGRGSRAPGAAALRAAVVGVEHGLESLQPDGELVLEHLLLLEDEPRQLVDRVELVVVVGDEEPEEPVLQLDQDRVGLLEGAEGVETEPAAE